MKHIDKYIIEKLHINKNVKVTEKYCDTLDQLMSEYNLKYKSTDDNNMIYVLQRNMNIDEVFQNITNDHTDTIENDINSRFLKGTPYELQVVFRAFANELRLVNKETINASIYYHLYSGNLRININTDNNKTIKLFYNILDYIFKTYK